MVERAVLLNQNDDVIDGDRGPLLGSDPQRFFHGRACNKFTLRATSAEVVVIVAQVAQGPQLPAANR